MWWSVSSRLRLAVCAAVGKVSPSVPSWEPTCSKHRNGSSRPRPYLSLCAAEQVVCLKRKGQRKLIASEDYSHHL